MKFHDFITNTSSPAHWSLEKSVSCLSLRLCARAVIFRLTDAYRVPSPPLYTTLRLDAKRSEQALSLAYMETRYRNDPKFSDR